MKTTVELPDELFREVKELAQAQGLTMRELIVDGLRAELARRADQATRTEFVFPSVRSGGLVSRTRPGAPFSGPGGPGPRQP